MIHTWINTEHITFVILIHNPVCVCPRARDLETQRQGQGQGNDVFGVNDGVCGALTHKLDRLMLAWKRKKEKTVLIHFPGELILCEGFS